jgi:hypothetical protein
MADTGAPWNLPYPLDTDLVIDGAQNFEDLADSVALGLTEASSNASLLTSGTIPAARLPNHSADLLTSGTLAAARLPTGSVIQVVGTRSTTSTASTGSFVTVMSQAITPASSAHRVVIVINVTAQVSFGSTLRYRLLRGATDVHSGTSGWTFQIGNAGGGDGRAADDNRISSYAVTLLDSPSTASSVTYNLQQEGSGTFNNGGSSAIVLMEVK